MGWRWLFVVLAILAVVSVGGYIKGIQREQKQDLRAVGSVATVLDKLAQQPVGPLPSTRASARSADFPTYVAEVKKACRTLHAQIAALPPPSEPRPRLSGLAQGLDSFVLSLVMLPAPPGHDGAARSLLSEAKSYRLHVQLALQGVLRGSAAVERLNLEAAKQDAARFAAAGRALGVTCGT